MTVLRTDILKTKKCVHVSFEKEVHQKFRLLMIRYNVSMQRILNDFAALCVSEDSGAIKVLERIVMDKVREEVEGKTKRNDSIDELDHDTLYSLMEEEDADEHH